MLNSASWSSLVLMTCAAYLVGSIPSGLLVGRLRGVDLRRVGSGNIGAANAFRSLGPSTGLLVMVLDALKGWAPVALTHAMFTLLACKGAPGPAVAEVVVGMGAIIGHNNSLYLRFRGGKGIATTFGVMLAISPLATLVAALVWLVAFALTRYSSVGSLAAATSIPLSLHQTHAPLPHVVFGVSACVLAFVRHRGNLRNLLNGEELGMTVRADVPSEPVPPCERDRRD